MDTTRETPQKKKPTKKHDISQLSKGQRSLEETFSLMQSSKVLQAAAKTGKVLQQAVLFVYKLAFV
jgi:hypothetical protein